MIVNLFELFWVIAFFAGFYHFTKTSSLKDALVFFVPALIWGILIEFFTLYLYKIYYYPSEYFLTIANVPIAIGMGWAIIMYVGYYITTKKFHAQKLLNIDLNTAAMSLAVDIIILEPIAFFYRFWVWDSNNFWFGAPLLNFVGWFLAVSIFITAYKMSLKHIQKEKQFVALLFSLLVGLLVLHSIGLTYFNILGPF
jgi:uncharacterized membrane protein